MNVATGRFPLAAAAMLVAHGRRVGAGPRALANVERLEFPGATVVVTGQQPGLLGGPLLALHKAAGAIARARRLEAETGRPVVPVFWVASEDHDVQEIDRAVVLDAAGKPTALSLGLPSDRRSVCDVAIEPAKLDAVLAALRAALPTTERGTAALALATPDAGADMGSWFASILARVLGDTGLVFVEPRHLAPFAGETYALLVERSDEIEAGVRAEGATRRARGDAAPLDRDVGTAPLFLRDGPGGARRRVSFVGDAVRLRGEASSMDRRALSELVRREPALAGGDVVGRVFVQNALFPVVEIIAGPTELAYLAQVGAGARAVGRTFPALSPRPSVLWLDARSSESLAAFGLDAVDVAEGRASAPASDAGPDAISDELADLVARVASLRARAVEERGADGGPSSVARDLDAVRGELEKTIRRRRDEREVIAGRGRARFTRLLAALRPLGEPQERVLSPISLIARHGLDGLRTGLLALESGATPGVITLG